MTSQDEQATLLKDVFNDVSNLINDYVQSTLALNNSEKEDIEKTVLKYVSEDLIVFAKKDPASKGRAQYIRQNYKTFKAIYYYRLANTLYYFNGLDQESREGIARGITEEAKVISRIDIHPAAKIGRRFVIDHGAGTVIGETCEIGDDCYLLQGVTLGARKTASNNRGKRHPTLGNWVEIGAFARIFGPVNIGSNVNISSHCVIKEDIPPSQNVMILNQIQLSRPRVLFNWKDVPGKDENRFLMMLKDNFNIDYEGNIDIKKTNDHRTISAFTDKNKILVEVTLETDKKAILKIKDGITYNLIIRDENDDINVYINSKSDKMEIYGIVPEKDGIVSIYGNNLIKASVLLLNKHYHDSNDFKLTVISNNDSCIRIQLLPEIRINEQNIRKNLKKVKLKILNDTEEMTIMESIGLTRAIESLKFKDGH